jgi:hypothetical protein
MDVKGTTWTRDQTITCFLIVMWHVFVHWLRPVPSSYLCPQPPFQYPKMQASAQGFYGDTYRDEFMVQGWDAEGLHGYVNDGMPIATRSGATYSPSAGGDFRDSRTAPAGLHTRTTGYHRLFISGPASGTFTQIYEYLFSSQIHPLSSTLLICRPLPSHPILACQGYSPNSCGSTCPR